MSEDADPLTALERARTEYEEARDALETVGEANVERARAVLERLDLLLESYEDRATGTGDFKAFVEFQSQVSELVDTLPEDVPEREAFEAVEDVFDKRRLSDRDFDRARDELAPVRDVVGLLEERDEAKVTYGDARRTAAKRVREIDARLDDVDRLLELGEVDLDAPVEELRGPILAYDEKVASAFTEFLHEESARNVLTFLNRTGWYPLVPFEPPPSELLEYVSETRAGTLSIPDLLAYADYSRSKLDHYVDDADELKRVVSSERLYLESIDSGPVRIGWPPPEPGLLGWRIGELVSVVGSFAPSAVIERLRDVRSLLDDEDRYEWLRQSAIAREELDEGQRARLASGAIEEERAALLEERERLVEALDSLPES